MNRNFANTNNNFNLALFKHTTGTQLERKGIYGASQPKGGKSYPCGSLNTPTDAVFVKLLDMFKEKFCGKGNSSTHTSTCAYDTGISANEAELLHDFIDFVDVKDVKNTLLHLLNQYFQHQDLDGLITADHQQKVLWHYVMLSGLLEGLHELQHKIYATN